ncbi:MAG: phosphate ABC transporter ATP-binding protein [Elusimicrobiota bacterium]
MTIHLSNLNVSYLKKTVVQNVNLSFNKGSITGIIGPSGCGKSSVLMAINRLTDLIPGCQVSGDIQFNDISILKKNIDLVFLRRKIGMIFQKPNPFPLSIQKNIEIPLREHGVKDKAVLENKIETSLRDVGLWGEVKDRLNQSALALSGGQQQRLCIARALALSPEVLLLDEPCSALDPISSGIVEDLIRSFKNRFTVVAVTHNLAQAERISDQVAMFWMMDGVGQLIESGSTKKIFEQPKHECTFAYVNGVRG